MLEEIEWMSKEEKEEEEEKLDDEISGEEVVEEGERNRWEGMLRSWEDQLRYKKHKPKKKKEEEEELIEEGVWRLNEEEVGEISQNWVRLRSEVDIGQGSWVLVSMGVGEEENNFRMILKGESNEEEMIHFKSSVTLIHIQSSIPFIIPSENEEEEELELELELVKVVFYPITGRRHQVFDIHHF